MGFEPYAARIRVFSCMFNEHGFLIGAGQGLWRDLSALSTRPGLVRTIPMIRNSVHAELYHQYLGLVPPKAM